MSLRYLGSSLIAASAIILITACGNSGDTVPLMGGNPEVAVGRGEALYLQAQAADQAGNAARAIKLYDRTASNFPLAPSAPKARFRQAELLEQRGEIVDSFDAYQQFLTGFQGSGLYSQALSRQAAMAQAAADGEVKSSFLGLRSKLSVEKTAEMLGKVRDNAPKSRTAAKAQFTIGELYQARKKPKEAIEAFRQLVRDQPESPEAPEALFRVGQILTAEADLGNRNQATLELAREAFNDYLLQYPGHHRNAEARANIGSLGGREVQRTFETAEYYLKTGNPDSARIYYRDVVKRSGAGQLHDAARARLRELGE